MLIGFQRGDLYLLPDDQRRQETVMGSGVRLWLGRLRQRFLVQCGKPWETHHCTSRPEAILFGGDIYGRMVEDSRTHLAGHEAIPDKRVQGLLFGAQVT